MLVVLHSMWKKKSISLLSPQKEFFSLFTKLSGMTRSHLWLLWLISVVLKMLGDCIKLCTPGEIFQSVDALSNRIQRKCVLADSILNFKDHSARHVFNNDEAIPSEVLAIWAKGFLARRHHYKTVTDTSWDCGTVPYSLFCCFLEGLTFGE